MIIPPHKLTIEDYHSSDAITSSKLRQFLSSPETYKDRLNGTHPDCKKQGGRHFIIGQLFEDMITLDTEQLEQTYYFCKGGEPEKPSQRILDAKKPSKESIQKMRDWSLFLGRTEGKTIISKSECDMLRNMLDSYYANTIATKLWNSMEYQMTIRHEVKGHDVQCRFDGLNTKYHQAVDLKTTAKPLEEFNKAIYDYRYDIQLALYAELYYMQFKQDLKHFYFIVAETIYPYRVQVMELPRFVLDGARELAVNGVEQMIECLDSQEFPDFPETSIINFSHWQLEQMGYETDK